MTDKFHIKGEILNMELIGLILPKIQMIPDLLFSIMLLATLISKLTPNKTDDEKISIINSQLQKVISFLPTLGVDKRTKALEEAYLQLSEKEKEEIPNK